MKKIFTIEDVIIALFTAIGYGLGYEIPESLNYPLWQCLVICLAVGIAPDILAHKIIFSHAIQKNSVYRFIACTVLLLIFFAAKYIANNWFGVSMVEAILEQYFYGVVFPSLAFAFRMLLRRYRIKKIREHYGDGSKGFVFEGQLKQSDIDKWNKQNLQIFGSYSKECAVKIVTGVFVGEKYKNALFFCGIPYAKPPVGELRWKAPETLPASDDVFEAKYLGASAIQVDYEGSLLKNHRQSEDCLTLNICVDIKKKKKKKPVVVIFHHGDFSYGGSADPLLYAENLNNIYSETVFVTFNYRLGIFGFIDFSEIPGGEDYPDALNLGLLDQIAALKWIKENISAFGGDPDNITVMGFEAGAISLCLLVASEQVKGLFQKAFIFFASPTAAYETPEYSRILAKKLFQETSTRNMRELMQLSSERLKEAAQKLILDIPMPTIDGKLFPKDVFLAYQNGVASNIDFIFGIPNNETYVYKSLVGNQKYEHAISIAIKDIMDYVETIQLGASSIIKEYIDEQAKTSTVFEAQTKLYEQFTAIATYKCAQSLAAGGSKVHLFYWDVKPLIENLGSGTVDVIATFLGNRDALRLYGNVLNADVAETLQHFFRKFKDEEGMRLFNNEIKGINAIDWKKFPQALIVSEKKIQCGLINDRLSEIQFLLNFIKT